MAIVHNATLSPSKHELITTWLQGQPWAGSGEVELVGNYRFDDPAGEVGVEAFVIRRGESLLHVPLTYRGAPLGDTDEHLVGTMQHSVLGPRWAYDGCADPVAVGCFTRALRGEQDQAEVEVWDGQTLLERRQPLVRVHREAANSGDLKDDARLQIVRSLGRATGGASRLVATWDGGSAVVATLG
jgi:Maltokinase N-terminal cap domain